MAKTARRRYQRFVHGMRRIKIDRMQHGSPYYHASYGEVGKVLSCECFTPETDRGRGKEFSRFADTPNPLRDPWKDYEPRASDRRAPRIEEWD